MLDKSLLNKLAFATSVKAAIGLTLVASIALYFHYTLFWWAIFTTFLCFSVDLGSSIMTMTARLFGTFIGAMCGVFITLIYQLPWLYFPVLFLFMFVVFYYTIKTNVSWVGFLVVVTTMVVAIAGPSYVNGAFHYAVERFMQICLAVSVVSLVLFILKGASAHGMLRERMVRLLSEYQTLWETVINDFAKGVRSDDVQPKVRAISIELVQMHALLGFTRYEFWKKNFNSGHGNALLHLMKQLLGLMTGINEVTRYVSAQDFSVETQQLVSRLDQVVKTALVNLASLVEKKETTYDQAIDRVESELHQFMDKRLEYHIQRAKQGIKLPLHRTAWFSLVVRMFRVTSFMRRVAVLMNSDKVNPQLRKQLTEELRWLYAENKREIYFNPVRLKLALHSSITVAIIVFFQQYFQWMTIFSVFAALVSLFISLSVIIPYMGNIGLGVVGGFCGLIYAYLASILLNYYPQYVVVLTLLFFATLIASYLLSLTKLQGRAFHAFSVFFTIIVVYSLMQAPESRANFNFAVCAISAIILAVVTHSLVSRFIFPVNYKSLLKNRLQSCLLNAAKVLRQVEKIEGSQQEVEEIMDTLYRQTQYINRARNSIRYCIDYHLYGEAKVKILHEVTYSCELMQLATLSILRSMIILSGSDLMTQVRHLIHKELRLIVLNLLQLAKNIKHNSWEQPLTLRGDEMKLESDILFQEFLTKIFSRPERVRLLRAVSIVYNAFYRMADVQNRLSAIEKFKF